MSNRLCSNFPAGLSVLVGACVIACVPFFVLAVRFVIHASVPRSLESFYQVCAADSAEACPFILRFECARACMLFGRACVHL